MSNPLPSAEEAKTHVCLWAMHCGGMQAVEGQVAENMGMTPGSLVPRWRPAEHLWFLGDLLMQVFRGELPRLIVSMPPRHGKSKLITQGFTGFWAGNRPDSEIMIASYGDRLTCKSSKKTKGDLIRCGESVFGVTALARESAQQWSPQVGGLPTLGSFLATSAGGTCTGEGADLLVIDDLLKGTAECRSKALRDQAWEFLIDEAMTRLSPGAPVIVVGTRWHPDDPIGRLLDAVRRGGNDDLDAIPWKYVALPAIAEQEDDALGRDVGEALWPSRFPVKALHHIKNDGRGPRSWAALYQCRPIALGGEFFKQKWLKYWTLDGPNAVLQDGTRIALSSLFVYITCDLAVSSKDKSDWSVIAVWGFSPERKSELVLLEMIRDRMDGPEMIPRIRGAFNRWGAKGIWIEKTIYHTSLIQMARSEGMLIGELKPDTDKKTRAIPATMAAEGGQLYFRGGAPWLAEFEDELLSFPEQGTADDQVDALCLGAGTMIETAHGPARIIDVQEGDRVWTRFGLRRVLWSGCSGVAETVRVHLSSGLSFLATPGHRVWTQNRGWIPIDSLSYADILEPWQNQNQLSSTGSSSGATRSPKLQHTGATTGRIPDTQSEASERCMSRCGRRSMDPFRRAARYITEMETRLTTRWRTWSASLQRSISSAIRGARSGSESSECTSSESARRRRSGIGRQKGERGMRSTESTCGKAERLSRSHASSAGRSRRHSSPVAPGSAPTNAQRGTGELLELTTNSETARGAPGCSRAIATPSSASAADGVRVLSVEAAGKHWVYDLTVEGAPEFYAAGVLVHNSYAVQIFQSAIAAPVEDTWAEDDPDGDAWWSGSRGDDW